MLIKYGIKLKNMFTHYFFNFYYYPLKLLSILITSLYNDVITHGFILVTLIRIMLHATVTKKYRITLIDDHEN